MDAFTIADVIECGGDEIRPVIVEFQNGSLNNANVQHELYTKDDKTFVKVETKISYKGEVKRDSTCNDFLAVVDRRTQQATLVPVDFAVLTPNVEIEAQNEQEDANDYGSALRTLKKEFGSKRMKLAAQQEERMRMNTSNTAKSLEEAVAEMDVDESNLETTMEGVEASYTPPINREAETVEEVYDLYSLVPKEVLDSLNGCVSQIFNDSDFDFDVINTYLVKSLLKQKREMGASKSVVRHCKILLVVDCIVKFLSMPVRLIGNRKHPICDYSQQVNQYILDTFTVMGRSGRNRSNTMKDKAICHCIVLLALVNNFVVNLEEVCVALKLKINKLQSIAKLLAFVPAQPKDKTKFVLKLPLPPPVQNLGRTPRKKR